MQNKGFKSIEQEVIYNKLIKYSKENNEHSINLVDANRNEAIDNMKRYKDVYAHRIIYSHRKKYIARIIIFCKKVMRRCLKWYINPITEQQTIFNNDVVQMSENLITRINELEAKNIQQQQEISNKDKEFKILLDELEREFSRIKELDKYSEKIVRLEENIEEINNEFDFNLKIEKSFFEKKSYSQSGEDSILAYILFVLGIKNEDITYLDLGANHAKELSNTYNFYKNAGKGVLVEANDALIPELSFYRHNDIILNSFVGTKDDEEVDFYVLSGDGLSTPDKEQAYETCKVNPNVSIDKVIKAKSITVNTIIEKYFGGVAPKIISIDIEGKDFEVLQSIDLEKYRPLLIVVETIEYRPYLSINIKKNSIVKYLENKDYIEYAFTGINSIFIDSRYMKSINQEG